MYMPWVDRNANIEHAQCQKYVKLGSYFIVYTRPDVETRLWQSFILRWVDHPNKSDAYFYEQMDGR